jgi:hypothetical protein
MEYWNIGIKRIYCESRVMYLVVRIPYLKLTNNTQFGIRNTE